MGKAFITINENGGNQPFEIFINTAKAGTPFVVDSHSVNAKAAMDAINALDETLNEAASWIAAN